MSEAVSINVCVVFTSDKWGSKRVCPHSFVCLSVSKITQKRMHRFGWNVACRQMSGHGRTDWLLSPIRIIVRMPEPDCFLRYRMRCNAKFYYVGKISRTGRCSDAWFWNGFIYREPWEQLCRRYMRSTECPSSLLMHRSPQLLTRWRPDDQIYANF